MQVVTTVLVWEQLWLYTPIKAGRSLLMQVCMPCQLANAFAAEQRQLVLTCETCCRSGCR